MKLSLSFQIIKFSKETAYDIEDIFYELKPNKI